LRAAKHWAILHDVPADATHSNDTPAIDELSQIASHPVLVGLLREIATASSEEERLALSRKLVSREFLGEQGVPLPPNLRVTMRFFEDPTAPLVSGGEVAALMEPYTSTETVVRGAGATLPKDPSQRDDHYRDPRRPPPKWPDLTHCVSVGGGPVVIDACYTVGG
jgi:hypothetical protein